MLNDANESVKEKSCYALEAFCENVQGDDMIPFLQPLVTRLTEMLQSSGRKVQEMCLSALASVAMAAADKFTPYFEGVYSLVRVLLTVTGEKELLLRARAMECLGHMNLAVGRQVCEKVLPEVTQAALAGLELDEAELREYTYGFFAQLAELLGAEFAPLLPQLMPRLLTSLESDDAIDFGNEGEKGGLRGIAAALSRGPDGDGDGADDDDDLDDDDDDDDGPGGGLSIRTALLDEKAAAAHCIGACAKHVGAPFLPYVERCLPSLQSQTEYFHEDVRGAVSKALAHLLVPAAAAENVPKWVKGQIASADSLPPNTRALLAQVLPALTFRFEHDDDKDVVAAASEALAEVASLLGPAAINAAAPGLIDTTITLLQRTHTCMDEFDEGLDDFEHDEIDHDSGLWEGVSELLTTLPKVLGDAWLAQFARLVPALTPYLGAGHSATDRSLAIGVLAESLLHLEGAGAGFFNQLLPLALRVSADEEDSSARQNATFCLGVLGLYGGPGVLHSMQQILTALQPRLAADEEGSVRDNAIGALARLAMAFGASLPLPTIVPAIVAALPLREDPTENVPVMRCLMRLAHDEATRAHVTPHLAAVLGAIGQLLAKDTKLATEELQAEMRAFVSWMVGSGLPPELQAAIPAGL